MRWVHLVKPCFYLKGNTARGIKFHLNTSSCRLCRLGVKTRAFQDENERFLGQPGRVAAGAVEVLESH
jgi:hypothetical protein